VNAGAILHFFVINDLVLSDALRGGLLHRLIF
jgi:hypothetical protein